MWRHCKEHVSLVTGNARWFQGPSLHLHQLSSQLHESVFCSNICKYEKLGVLEGYCPPFQWKCLRSGSPSHPNKPGICCQNLQGSLWGSPPARAGQSWADPSEAVDAGLREQWGSSGREIASILSMERKTSFSTGRNIRFPSCGKWVGKKELRR